MRERYMISVIRLSQTSRADILGPVYMRGGMGRLPGRDDARDPDMYMFL